ncbi:MAG: glycosyltransferase [Candidatus Aenigmarchaeota archaeon]|nr:glycosyltransferase [Candidatus Aenigmarchaeota archaeon]
MKVLLISTPFLPLKRNLGYGGSERVVVSLYEQLKRINGSIEVYLAAPGTSEIADFHTISRPIGIDDIYGNRISDLDKTNLRLEHISLSIKFIKELEPHIIHIHDDNFLPFMKFYKNSLLTLHSDPDSFWNPELHPNLVGKNTNLVAISEYTKKKYEERGWKILDVVYNGIDLDGIQPEKEKLNYLYWIGVINPHKGLHIAVQVALQTGYDLVFSGIIGNQEYFSRHIEPFITHNINNENNKLEAYLRISERNKGQKIIYTGEVNNEQKYPLFSKATATLVPSLFYEPFGLVVVESLATGTPVIGSNIGGISEIIEDEISGILISTPEDIKELEKLREPDNNSEIYRKIIESYIDSLETIKRIEPEECRKRAEEFSSENMANKYLDLYRKILS